MVLLLWHEKYMLAWIFKSILQTAQGEVEFRSVLYVPRMGPLNNEYLINPKTKNIRLYVKCVFISDDFDGKLVSCFIVTPNFIKKLYGFCCII